MREDANKAQHVTTPFLGWNAKAVRLQMLANTNDNIHIDVHRLI
jgi:hypothetical protein